MEYIKGSFFIIYYITVIYLLGTAVAPGRSMPFRIVAGYILHTLVLSTVAIPVQMFNLNYFIYYFFVPAADLLIVIWSVIHARIKRINLLGNGLVSAITNYWFLMIVLLGLCFLLTTYNSYFWSNNATDDSSYLVSIAQMPYFTDPFNINVRNGLPVASSNILNQRNITTFEIEGSVYCSIFGVFPSLFARFFLSVINYVVVICSFYCMAEIIVRKSEINIEKKKVQYTTLAVSVVCINQTVLAMHHILDIRDNWVINSAMYYGSALIRLVAIIWLIYPFIYFNKINKKFILIELCIIFCLFTKSVVVLPVIGVVLVVSIGIYIYDNYGKKYIIVYSVAYIIINIIIRDNGRLIVILSGLKHKNTWYLMNNLQSFLLIPGVLICAYFLLRNINIIRYLIVSAFSYVVLMSVEPLNNVVELFSVYNFVLYRAQGTIVQFFISFTTICIIILLLEKTRMRSIVVGAVSVAMVFGGSFLSFRAQEGSSQSMKDELELFTQNKYLMPNDVILLARDISEWQKENSQQAVVMAPSGRYPEENQLRGYVGRQKYMLPELVSPSLRIVDPSIISLNSMGLGSGGSSATFRSLSIKDTQAFEMLEINQSPDTLSECSKILKKYPINCIVVGNKNADSFLRNEGFTLYKESGDPRLNTYYIYCKKLSSSRAWKQPDTYVGNKYGYNGKLVQQDQ